MRLRSKIQKLPRRIVNIVLRPFYFLAAIFLVAFRVRFAELTIANRIGHLALDVDCFLKSLELMGGRRVRPVLLLHDPSVIPNDTLLRYWATRISVISNAAAIKSIRHFRKIKFIFQRFDKYSSVVGETAECFRIYAKWNGRPPLLRLTDADVLRGRAILRRLGVPEAAWFVCVHAREPGYAKYDDALHAYRNSSIASYRLAMEAIAARGGWCVRMGDSTSEPIEPMAGVVDYAHSEYKSDFMDVFLCAQCRFFLGGGSGFYNVSSIFGVPVAAANAAPLDCVYLLNPFDLSIPKLLATKDGVIIHFSDALSSPAGSYRFSYQYESDGLITISNTPHEILELTLEMLDRLDNCATQDDERDEKLQVKFRSLLKPGHYSYGSCARIGRDFLRRYASLLEPCGDTIAHGQFEKAKLSLDHAGFPDSHRAGRSLQRQMSASPSGK